MKTNMSDDEGRAFVQELLDSCGVDSEAIVAAPDDDRGAQRLFDLREAVPAGVNALVAAAKARAHPDIEKTAGDMVVPFSRLADSLALYRRAFESRGLDYAIWGHVSDGNLHPNLIPRTFDDMTRAREAIFEISRGVIGMDGAPLAEHGVGRSTLNSVCCASSMVTRASSRCERSSARSTRLETRAWSAVPRLTTPTTNRGMSLRETGSARRSHQLNARQPGSLRPSVADPRFRSGHAAARRPRAAASEGQPE